MPHCEECGKEFEKTSPNRIYCDGCSAIHGNMASRYFPGINAVERRIRAALESRVKVWRNSDYSQDFLRTLVPSERGK
jgi:predicted  nucleic acid-binding Zn-ribbon protein